VKKMHRVKITQGFWFDRLETNAKAAIFHQWEQLEASGCIENFRIAAGESSRFREGYFFADSDAYKWLDAASRIIADRPDPQLGELIDGLAGLLERAQQPDGYLFTYNQIHFPTVRWKNLQIEHELYCHGHLIEAGVSHYQATGSGRLINIARRAADRIVADFMGKNASATPGHEEIEIALLRLHQVTPGDTAYLAMARQFIEQRGRTRHFGLSFLRQAISAGQRSINVQQKKRKVSSVHPGSQPHRLPPGNTATQPPFLILRALSSALSGKYFQQHAPIRAQVEPVGHAVRFAYQETAAAMLARECGDTSLLPGLERAWEQMVMRRMFLTGGIGALPGIEGFGRDYELDPIVAYAETCAALGSLFWNWEMSVLTGAAKYADLFEWQLYNAAAVGMGLDGKSYFYNNPLASHGGVERRHWFAVPCCPSNLSRTWADLGKYVYVAEQGKLRIQQYIGSHLAEEILPCCEGGEAAVSLKMESGLPWAGQVRIKIAEVECMQQKEPVEFEIMLRLPSWAGGMSVILIEHPAAAYGAPQASASDNFPASGYDPRRASYLSLRRSWSSGDEVEIEMTMPIRLRRAHPKVKGHRGKAAVTRGPLVYCLEDIDNPGTDIFTAAVMPGSLRPVFDKHLLGGIVKIQGTSSTGATLTFIPYFLWGNRGPSQMTVWIYS
jgi:DUF1680 family protein